MNINSLEYGTNDIVKNFFNTSFKNGPVITKLIGIARHRSTPIDRFLKKAILSTNVSCGILRPDISYHFLILTKKFFPTEKDKK